MKSRGFTLVELLAVIVILMVISLIIVTATFNIVDTSNETVYQVQVNTILNAAYDFSLKNLSYLPDENQKKYITLGELKYSGFLSSNITDPNTKEKFRDDLVVSIENVGKNYKNSNKNAKKQGSYLYKIEFDKLDSAISPILNLTYEGISNVSNTNYTLSVNLNDEINISDVGVTSMSGENNISDRVKKYIVNNDKTVDSIDTSQFGIYKVYYSVVDDDGYSSMVVLNIIVADNEIPVISLPDENTISIDMTNYNLLEGVTRKDNSGFCTLTHTGTINYQSGEKSIIEYTAEDPSGNTATARRVITIE